MDLLMTPAANRTTHCLWYSGRQHFVLDHCPLFCDKTLQAAAAQAYASLLNLNDNVYHQCFDDNLKSFEDVLTAM
jgi:hypothetical protein